MKTNLLVCLFFYYLNGFSQVFVPTNTDGFLNLFNSYASVGDYDNDNDLDIIIMGIENSQVNVIHTKIYNNDGSGNFSLSTISFPDKYRNGQVKFIDYDNDNDLDVFISGLDENANSKTTLYENTEGNFLEVPFNFNTNIFNNQFNWSDLDNDGDLDVIIKGTVDTFSDLTYLFKNEGNDVFTELNVNIQGLSQGKIQLVDFNNDGYNDVITTGLDAEVFLDEKTYVYKNNGDFTFELKQEYDGLFNGTLEVRDVNDDGLIDFFKSGNMNLSSSVNTTSKIYLNTTEFNFNEYSTILFPSLDNEAVFKSADLTGNGALDFLLLGLDFPYTTNATYTKTIYINDGNFNLTQENVSGIPENSWYAFEFGDFDNDHDIDVFGLNTNNTGTYLNQSSQTNTQPKKPENVSSQVNENSITINWTEPNNNDKQLSYNVYIGTEQKITDILSPMANLDTGYRKIVDIGNAQYKNELTINNLANGTYYYGIQSIDNQYEGSLFTEEKTFVVNTLGLNNEVFAESINMYPNPVETNLNIKSLYYINECYLISTICNQVFSQENLNQKEFKLNLSKLKSGVYFLKILTSNKTASFKILKK